MGFPATGGPVVIYDANEGTSGTVPANATEYNSEDVVTVLGNTGNLVGDEVGGDHTGSGIKQRIIGWNTDSAATTAEYVAGDTFTITENTTLYAIYTTGTDVLGKVGPAGGWIFYDAGSTPPDWGRYLEAAPASTEWTEKEWGDKGTEIGGNAALTEIGAGQAATTAIVLHMQGCDPPITDTAAQLCDDLEQEHEGTTYDDWFLPSKEELNMIYSNLANELIGEFLVDFYWSSSDYNDNDAWNQHFQDGDQVIDNMNDKVNANEDSGLKVRAVRAF